ncbi:MAG: peptidoglycan DD-metalloendopeptidase family protein, partial [Deltaproteobacteria bacterium]|nr:peptidoglycan DD-metalloendopeptidase family protein [Deltaproteobacteria bacterium]
MLRHPILLLFVCLVLISTAYDASAKARQTDTAEYSTKKTKAAQSKTAVSKEETAKAPGTSSTAGSAKKPSKKQHAQVPAKSNAAKDKVSQNRKQKKPSRDPASLPGIDEAFAETPDVVLAMLSAIPADGSISSYFGMRRLSSKTKRVRMHTGIDITAPRGAPVLAAASGVVRFADRWSAYGRVVEIDHGNGLVTRYAHLDSYANAIGAKVTAGEQIGTVGRTGRTTGAHLHFETLVNGRPV